MVLVVFAWKLSLTDGTRGEAGGWTGNRQVTTHLLTKSYGLIAFLDPEKKDKWWEARYPCSGITKVKRAVNVLTTYNSKYRLAGQVYSLPPHAKFELAKVLTPKHILTKTNCSLWQCLQFTAVALCAFNSI